MKVCSTCKLEKPSTNFYKSKNKPGGLAYSCKQCSDLSNKKTRTKFGDKYLGFRRDYKNKLQEQYDEYKSSRGCQLCKEASPCALDLHHPDPSTKEASPSELRGSWTKWFEEAKKCIVLCSNCHRKVHAGILNVDI